MIIYGFLYTCEIKYINNICYDVIWLELVNSMSDQGAQAHFWYQRVLNRNAACSSKIQRQINDNLTLYVFRR